MMVFFTLLFVLNIILFQILKYMSELNLEKFYKELNIFLSFFSILNAVAIIYILLDIILNINS